MADPKPRSFLSLPRPLSAQGPRIGRNQRGEQTRTVTRPPLCPQGGLGDEEAAFRRASSLSHTRTHTHTPDTSRVPSSVPSPCPQHGPRRPPPNGRVLLSLSLHYLSHSPVTFYLSFLLFTMAREYKKCVLKSFIFSVAWKGSYPETLKFTGQNPWNQSSHPVLPESQKQPQAVCKNKI